MIKQTQKELENGKHGQKPKLWERMKRKAKLFTAKTLMIAGLAGGLALPASAKADGWATVWPGYSTTANRPTLRIEGGASFDSGTSFYAFGDFEPTEKNSMRIDGFYGAARVSQSVYNGLGLFGEMEMGTGMQNIYKPGIYYALPLEDWFVQLRLAPWMMGGKEDVQLAAYMSKTFGGVLSTELLLKANLLSQTMYWEFAADILFAERFSVGSQLRMFTDFQTGHTDVTPVARVGVRF